ncbi:MAG TPA: hypothetical protein VI756_09930 [Blastocatellia bacterium]
MSLRRPAEVEGSIKQFSRDDAEQGISPSEDLAADDEFAEASESLARALEKAGITRSALESTLPEARRRVFARHYPQLASELDQEHPTGGQ